MVSLGNEDQNKKNEINIPALVSKINNALIKLEHYWNAGSFEYEYFGFAEHFSILFNERAKSKLNINFYGINVEKYWDVIHKIHFTYEHLNNILPFKEEFPGMELFFTDINEINDLHAKRIVLTGVIFPFNEFAIITGTVTFLYLLKERQQKESTFSYSYSVSDPICKWDNILFSAFDEKDYAWIETWAIKQPESGYSKSVFFRQLIERWGFFNNLILSTTFKAEQEANFNISFDYGITVRFSSFGQKDLLLNRNNMILLYKKLQGLYNHFGLDESGLIVETSTEELKTVIKGKPAQNPDCLNTKKQHSNNYSQKQIAIAYCIMGIAITSQNAAELLLQHSQTRSSSKLMQKRIFRSNDLTKISGNKTTDTKHLQDLQAVELLLSSIKDMSYRNDITAVIQAFEKAYHAKY
jgi:hypothetical protein